MKTVPFQNQALVEGMAAVSSPQFRTRPDHASESIAAAYRSVFAQECHIEQSVVDFVHTAEQVEARELWVVGKAAFLAAIASLAEDWVVG